MTFPLLYTGSLNDWNLKRILTFSCLFKVTVILLAETMCQLNGFVHLPRECHFSHSLWVLSIITSSCEEMCFLLKSSSSISILKTCFLLNGLLASISTRYGSPPMASTLVWSSILHSLVTYSISSAFFCSRINLTCFSCSIFSHSEPFGSCMIFVLKSLSRVICLILFTLFSFLCFSSRICLSLTLG